MIPIKVNIFFWRMINNGLPLKPSLITRGVQLDSTLCDLCNHEEETLDHCFFRCTHTQGLWRKLWAWWGLSTSRFVSLEALQTNSLFSNGPKNKRNVFNSVCWVALWAIWTKRNKIWHANEEDQITIKEEDLFPAIQRLAALWISSRRRNLKIAWENWISNPLQAI